MYHDNLRIANTELGPVLYILTRRVRKRSADGDGSAQKDKCAALRYQKVHPRLDPVTLFAKSSRHGWLRNLMAPVIFRQALVVDGHD
jgi:hypothetical protein